MSNYALAGFTTWAFRTDIKTKNRPFYPNRATNVISFMGFNKVRSITQGCVATQLHKSMAHGAACSRGLLIQPDPVYQLLAWCDFVQFRNAPKKQRKKHNGCCYSYHNHTPFPFKLTIQISHYSLDQAGRLRFDQHGSNIWHGFDNFKVPLVRFRHEMPVSDVILQS